MEEKKEEPIAIAEAEKKELDIIKQPVITTETKPNNIIVEKKSFWERHKTALATVSLASLIISFTSLIIVFLNNSPFISFIWFNSKPTISFTSLGCLENDAYSLKDFFANKCNEMSVTNTEIFNFTDKDFPNIKLTQGTIINAKINKAYVYLCTVFTTCTYNLSLGFNISLKGCAYVCITRANTNETTCFSSPECNY